MRSLARALTYLFAALVALPLAGCRGGQVPGSEANLAGTSWRLVSFGAAGSETPLIEGTDITLEFEAGRQAGGSSGCNSYGARYEIADGVLKFTEITSTLMACTAEGIMEQEGQYLAALQSAGEYTLTGDALTIRYDDGARVLNFVWK